MAGLSAKDQAAVKKAATQGLGNTAAGQAAGNRAVAAGNSASSSAPAGIVLGASTEFGAAGRGEYDPRGFKELAANSGGGKSSIRTQRSGESDADYASYLRTAPFSLAGGSSSGSITSQSLSNSGTVNLPTPSYTDYSGGLASAFAALPKKKKEGEDERDPMTGQVMQRTDQYDVGGLSSLMQQLERGNRPPDTARIYQDMERQSGVRQHQQQVNDYTAQLDAIQKKAEAEQLSLEGQGRGIPEVIIGGQQAKISREAAIRALPVAAQLQAAQGNLQTAQQHLDTMFQLTVQDAQNQYEHRSRTISAVMGFATAAEQQRLKLLDRDAEREFTLTRDVEKTRHDMLSTAIAQRAPQAIINAIMNAQTSQQAITAAGVYGTDMLGREKDLAQIAATNQSNRSNGGGSKGDSTVINQVLDGFTDLSVLTPTKQQEVRDKLYAMGFSSDAPPAWFKEYIENEKQMNLLPQFLQQEWIKYRDGVLATGKKGGAKEGEVNFDDL